MGFKQRASFETQDITTVNLIDFEISRSATRSDVEEATLKNNCTNIYNMKLSNKQGGYSARLYFDTLYNKAYIVKDGGLWDISTDMARYIDSLLENTPTALTSQDAEAVALLSNLIGRLTIE